MAQTARFWIYRTASVLKYYKCTCYSRCSPTRSTLRTNYCRANSPGSLRLRAASLCSSFTVLSSSCSLQVEFGYVLFLFYFLHFCSFKNFDGFVLLLYDVAIEWGVFLFLISRETVKCGWFRWIWNGCDYWRGFLVFGVSLLIVICCRFWPILISYFWSMMPRISLYFTLRMRIALFISALCFVFSTSKAFPLLTSEMLLFDCLCSLFCWFVDIWSLQEVSVCIRCTVVRLFIWFVTNFFLSCTLLEVSDLFFLDLDLLLVHIVEFVAVCFHFSSIWNFVLILQVRHAQAVHNVAMEKDRSLLQSYDYFDAQLSDLGWLQVYATIPTIIYTPPTYEPTYWNRTFT